MTFQDWIKLFGGEEKIPAEALAAAKAFWSDDGAQTLIAQRDQARRESQEQRKTLKAKVAEYEKLQSVLRDRLDADEEADLIELVESFDFKKATKAGGELEARLKRLEREIAAKDAALNEERAKATKMTIDGALAKALGKFQWVDQELTENFLRPNVTIDGEKPVLKAADGTLLPLEEGVAVLAKTKPHLLKAQGGGSGSGWSPDAGTGQQKAFKDMTLTEKGQLFKKDPDLYKRLEAEHKATTGAN